MLETATQDCSKVGLIQFPHGLCKWITLWLGHMNLTKVCYADIWMWRVGGAVGPVCIHIYITKVYLPWDCFLHQCNHIGGENTMAMIFLISPCCLGTEQPLTIRKNKVRRPVCKSAKSFNFWSKKERWHTFEFAPEGCHWDTSTLSLPTALSKHVQTFRYLGIVIALSYRLKLVLFFFLFVLSVQYSDPKLKQFQIQSLSHAQKLCACLRWAYY